MKRVRPEPLPPSAIFSWIVVMMAAWLAVGGQAWAQTLLICSLGGLYLFFPPSGLLPKSLFALIGLLLLLSGVAFLPASWFNTAFRQPFQDHGIVLPWTLSPQPWLSLEGLSLLATTILWAWFCFEARLSVDQRKLLNAGYLIGLGLLALNIILQGTSVQGMIPPFLRGAGQFENRNQTGDLLLMGGIASVSRGFADLSKARMQGLLWMAMAAVFMVAIIENGSRAAVILFGLGLLLLLGLMPEFRTRNRLPQVIGILAVFIGSLIFASIDIPFRDRFLSFLTDGQDDRMSIYRDTAQMVMRDPWCGIGLGNFEGVFNVQRSDSAQFAARCLHPDSDWMWLAAESGWGGVAIFAGILAMTFKSYLGKAPSISLRNTSITIAVLFLIHTLFDVGGHRPGTVWNCLYLVSLGAFRPAVQTKANPLPFVLRLTGFLLIVLALLRIQSTGLHPMMPTRASMARADDSILPGLPRSEQKEALDQSISWEPLSWLPYYQRAILNSHSADHPENSEDDFNRALYLEQNSTELPLAIGERCRHSDLSESLVAWKELLRRAGDRKAEFLQNLYWNPGLDVKTRLQMTILAGDDPNLQIITIINQDSAEFSWLCENFLTENPMLKGVDSTLARRLFASWVASGDTAGFIDEWPKHAEWQAPGWRAYSTALAKVGRYNEAVTLALQQVPAPHMPEVTQPHDVSEALRLSQANPQDAFYLMQLYFAQLAIGANDDAVTTLEQAGKLPKRPDYVPYLLAKTLMTSGRYEEAWRILEPVLDPPQK